MSFIRRNIHHVVYAFFLSGAVSLIYQVTWVRMLSLFFGPDSLGVRGRAAAWSGVDGRRLPGRH